MPAVTLADRVPVPPPQSRIWRYMDLGKYLAMLTTATLWFPRADQLGDPYEGARTFVDPSDPSMLDWFEYEWGITFYAAQVKRTSFVSCWNIAEVESAALWATFGPRGQGIAVQATVGRLMQLLDGWPDQVIVGQVAYLDFRREETPVGAGIDRLFLKRKSFEHERELRAILEPHAAIREAERTGTLYESPVGIAVPLALADLIESVYVEPTSPEWFADAVRATTHRLGLDVPVQRSDMDASPLF